MIYQGIIKMDGQTFQEFIDPLNSVAQLLIAHFITIEIIMMPIVDREYGGRARTTPARTHLDWLTMIYRNCPLQMRTYLKWPLAVKDCVTDELDGKERLVPTISILRKKEGLCKALF
jgi:hypothetical protein